ncbi:hypothetical protein N0V90_002365 [Kalmusia sp. IMI 367209]|nr:hypothetical protein N0V90_002365 [Kalmusia sp. IMI 367209]
MGSPMWTSHNSSGLRFIGLLLLAVLEFTAAQSLRERISINADWRFSRFTSNPDQLSYATLKSWILPSSNDFNSGTKYKRPSGTPPGGNVQYVQSTFDDSKWEPVDLPHDWAIKGPFGAPGIPGSEGKLPYNGVGWYRKKITVDAADIKSGKSLYLDIDGAMSYASTATKLLRHSLIALPAINELLLLKECPSIEYLHGIAAKQADFWNDHFGVYLHILEKRGDMPLLYVGSTYRTFKLRHKCYKSGDYPSLDYAQAIKKGYKRTAVIYLAAFEQGPITKQLRLSHALARVLEAMFIARLWTYKSETYGTVTELNGWKKSSLQWFGLNGMNPIREAVPLLKDALTLSDEDLKELEVKRKARKAELDALRWLKNKDTVKAARRENRAANNKVAREYKAKNKDRINRQRRERRRIENAAALTDPGIAAKLAEKRAKAVAYGRRWRAAQKSA